jgi:AcrR family transcriptional regulator
MTRLAFREPLAALEDVHRELHADVLRAVRDAPAGNALSASVGVVVELAILQPDRARLLMGEAVGGGPSLRRERAEGIARLARAIEDAYRRAPPDAPAPDLSSEGVIGGVYRLLDSILRRGHPIRTEMAEELGGWIASYAQPLDAHRWRSLRPVSPPPILPPVAEARPRAPAAPDPRASRLSAAELAALRREQILLATAEVTARVGYGAASVAAISRAAGVDTSVFHSHFRDKQAALTAVHELHYQQMMMSAAGAFFSSQSWPERIWLVGGTFAQYLQRNPTLAVATLVEGQAGDPQTLKRGEDLVAAFTIFLQEGYQHLLATEPPSRLALAAISATMFEVAYERARTNAQPGFAGLVPHGVHLCLTPFLGPRVSNTFIDTKLATG